MAVIDSGKEIKVDPYHMIVSRTDVHGFIEYANGSFTEISGYALSELMHKPHNIVRHPDMPAVVFKWMWNRIQEGRDIYAVVKNRAKNGDFYWVTTKFDIKRHPTTHQVTGYAAYRQGAPAHVVDTVSKLYAQLLRIEKAEGVDASEKYFIDFLESKGLDYDRYIHDLVGNGTPVKSFFKKMIDLFH